jgi:dTDP-4-amino-4,6-dideoxygalactose transaminase
MSYRIRLVRPSLPDREAIDAAVDAMYATGQLTNFGPRCIELEEAIAAFTGAKHAAAVANATSGLWLLLNTLPPGEVIVPSFTFLATGQAITTNSVPLTPVFADIDPDTLNVSPESVARCITPRTVAIVGVHLFGVPADVEALQAIARERDVPLFLDAAHAFGSRHRGVPVGTFGDAEVFSISATKVLPGGEGGVITTNSDLLHRRMLDRRNYGFLADGSGDCENDGLNAKITEFSAAMAVRAMDTIGWRIDRRNELARMYRDLLHDVPGIRFQTMPADDVTTVKDFTIRIDTDDFGMSRDALQKNLKTRGIETAAYFSRPLHRMTRFRQFPCDGALAATEEAAERILSLPLFEELTRAEVEEVAAAIRELSHASRAA